MQLPWEQLSAALAARGLETTAGVSEAQLAEAAATLGFAVPPWLADLYRRWDGVPLAPPSRLELAGAQPQMAILPLSRALAWSDVVVYAGPGAVKLFFFAENESDPLAQFVDGPLVGHVIRLEHDGGGARLLFRDEGELLQAVIALVASGATSLDELTPTMEAGLTTEADVLVGLAAAKPEAVKDLNEASRSLVRQLAADLLGGSDETSLGELLGDDDIYVRESAELQLRRRKDPAAQRMLKAYALQYDAFAERCRAALQRAGWTVPHEPDDEDAVITWRALAVDEPGSRIHLGLGMFYERRQHADFEAWLVQRVKDLKQRNELKKSKPRP